MLNLEKDCGAQFLGKAKFWSEAKQRATREGVIGFGTGLARVCTSTTALEPLPPSPSQSPTARRYK